MCCRQLLNNLRFHWLHKMKKITFPGCVLANRNSLRLLVSLRLFFLLLLFYFGFIFARKQDSFNYYQRQVTLQYNSSSLTYLYHNRGSSWLNRKFCVSMHVTVTFRSDDKSILMIRFDMEQICMKMKQRTNSKRFFFTVTKFFIFFSSFHKTLN